MFIKTLLIFIIAFFGYMHCYWGSTMWNRPIIMSTLTGLALGDIRTGIIVGSALELAFLGAVPIGASNPPDMTSGSIIAAAFVILNHADTGLAVTIAIPIATLVALFDNLQMMFLLTYSAHLCDAAAENGDANKVERIVRIASIGNKIALSLIVAAGFYFGSSIIELFITQVPEWFSHGMNVVAGILPALGIAMLARMMVSKQNWGYLLIGFLISAYLDISTLGVALAGIAVSSILFFTQSKKNDVSVQEAITNDNEF